MLRVRKAADLRDKGVEPASGLAGSILGLGQVDAPSHDERGDQVQAHGLVGTPWVVGTHGQIGALQVLDQRDARGLVLDQDEIDFLAVAELVLITIYRCGLFDHLGAQVRVEHVL